MARAAINNFPELDIPNLESLFTEIQYPKDYEIIKSSKDKDATLFNGYYYNFSRKNLRSTVFKCRATFNGVECTGRFTLKNDNSYELNG